MGTKRTPDGEEEEEEEEEEEKKEEEQEKEEHAKPDDEKELSWPRPHHKKSATRFSEDSISHAIAISAQNSTQHSTRQSKQASKQASKQTDGREEIVKRQRRKKEGRAQLTLNSAGHEAIAGRQLEEEVSEG